MERTMLVNLQIAGHDGEVCSMYHELYNEDTNQLDFEAICPLEGRNQAEYWGPFTSTHVISSEHGDIVSILNISTDAHFYQFVIQMSINYPLLTFIYRSTDFKNRIADSIVISNGCTVYPYPAEGVIHHETDIFAYEYVDNVQRIIEWSETERQWVYQGDLFAFTYEDTLPQPIPRLVSGQVTSDDILVDFLFDVLNEEEEDPHMDDASQYLEDQYYDSSDEGEYDDEYGTEEDEDEDEPVTIQAFQGNLPDDAQCSICLEVPQNPQLISCTHIFCNTCITQWLATKHRCPLCRRRVQ